MKPEPLVRPEQAERWLMRQHLAAETTRVVTAVWWGVYTVRDALRELRGQAFLIAQRNGVDEKLADAVAVSAFDDEMQRQEAEHTTSADVMAQAALVCLQSGMPEAQARRVMAQHAQDRPLAPPLHIVTQAWERAKREYQFSQRALKRRP